MGPKKKAATPQEEGALMKDHRELEARIMDMEEEGELESEWHQGVQDQEEGGVLDYDPRAEAIEEEIDWLQQLQNEEEDVLMEDNPVLEQALLEEAFIEEAFLAESFMEEAFMARVRDMEEERQRESEMLQQLQRELESAFLTGDPDPEGLQHLQKKDDPELEAIRAKIRSMEEESEKLRQLQNEVGEVKKEITAKEALLQEIKSSTERIIHSRAPEIRRLVKALEQAKDRILNKQKEIAELDAKKVKLIQECEQEKVTLGKLTMEQGTIENFISVKTKEARTDMEKLGKEIESLKVKEKMKKKTAEERTEPTRIPDSWKFEYISKKIEAKEKDLECPVCFEVASTPIFKCSEDHLICSVCRPKMSQCPECRVRYTGEPRRHRYAEKAAEELEELWRERAEVLGD